MNLETQSLPNPDRPKEEMLRQSQALIWEYLVNIYEGEPNILQSVQNRYNDLLREDKVVFVDTLSPGNQFSNTVGQFNSDTDTITLTPDTNIGTMIHEKTHYISTHIKPDGRKVVGFRNDNSEWKRYVNEGVNDLITYMIVNKRGSRLPESILDIKCQEIDNSRLTPKEHVNVYESLSPAYKLWTETMLGVLNSSRFNEQRHLTFYKKPKLDSKKVIRMYFEGKANDFYSYLAQSLIFDHDTLKERNAFQYLHESMEKSVNYQRIFTASLMRHILLSSETYRDRKINKPIKKFIHLVEHGGQEVDVQFMFPENMKSFLSIALNPEPTIIINTELPYVLEYMLTHDDNSAPVEGLRLILLSLARSIDNHQSYFDSEKASELFDKRFNTYDPEKKLSIVSFFNALLLTKNYEKILEILTETLINLPDKDSIYYDELKELNSIALKKSLKIAKSISESITNQKILSTGPKYMTHLINSHIFNKRLREKYKKYFSKS